jgi:DNA polymerase III sliding clamp (beta) subunit (PCNA family)
MAKKTASKAPVSAHVIDARVLYDLLRSFGFVDYKQMTGFLQIELSPNLVTMVGSDGAMRMRKSVGCVGTTTSSIRITNDKFRQTLKELVGNVSFFIADGKITVEQESKSYTVSGEPGELIEFAVPELTLKSPGSLIRHGLQKAMPFTSTDPSREAMNGVRFEGKPGEGIRFVGTSGFVLCDIDFPQQVVDKPFGVTIPRSACSVIGGVAATEFGVYLTDDTVGFVFENGLFESLLITDPYPNALDLLNHMLSQPTRTVVVNGANVEHVRKLCTLYCGSDDAMRLFVGKDRVTGRSEDRDFGGSAVQWTPEANDQLESNIGMKVNVDYLGACLRAIDSKTIAISFGDAPDKAVIFQPTEHFDGQKLVCLLMPVRFEDYAEEMVAQFGEVISEAA